VAMILPLAGCATPPMIVGEAPPDYVVINQSLGLQDWEAAVRLKANKEAQIWCQRHGRQAILPPEISCAFRHWVLKECTTYSYTYRCFDFGSE